MTRIPEVLDRHHLPSLDGLRAFSILLVVFCHILISFKIHLFAFNFALLGVQCFFVISGFLITTLLIKEKCSNGCISLKNFYFRRAFRILPVAYLYLLVVVALNMAFHLHLNGFLLLASFLFIRNFFLNATGIDHFSTHYWSLSVEEQFYMLFPFILKKSLRAYIVFNFFVIFSSLVIGLLDFTPIFSLGDRSPLGIGIRALTQFQGIAVGSLTAIILFKTKGGGKLRNKAGINVILFALVFGLALQGSFSLLADLCKSILFAAILILNLHPSQSIIFKILNSWIMKLIGVMSFSIYIWQQPFTQSLGTINRMGYLNGFEHQVLMEILITVVGVGLLSIVACASYFLFEKSFLRLRRRFR